MPKHLHRPLLKCSLQKGLNQHCGRTTPKNESDHHRYRGFLADAKGASEATIAGVIMAALARFSVHRPSPVQEPTSNRRAFKGSRFEAKAEGPARRSAFHGPSHLARRWRRFSSGWRANQLVACRNTPTPLIFQPEGHQGGRLARLRPDTPGVPTLAQVIDRVL